MLEAGSIVKSKKGHDTGRMYVVLNLLGEFAEVCDGDIRTKSHPKKKRQTHLCDTYQKIEKVQDLKDYEIKTMLKNISHKN